MRDICPHLSSWKTLMDICPALSSLTPLHNFAKCVHSITKLSCCWIKIVVTSSLRNVCCSMRREGSTWNSWRPVQTAVGGEIDTMGINFTPGMDGIKIRGPAESWVATLSENTSDSSPEHRNAKPLRDSISDCQNFVWACPGFSKKHHDLLGAVSGFPPSFLPKVSTDSLHTSGRNTSCKICKSGKLNAGNLYPENWFKWGKSGPTSSLKF